MLCQTGWKLKKSVVFLLPPRYFSLIMMVFALYPGYTGTSGFSEDTYRTLMGGGLCCYGYDGSKGVEAQTIKLFKVCVMRGIPIFTFINKMDPRGYGSI